MGNIRERRRWLEAEAKFREENDDLSPLDIRALAERQEGMALRES